MSSKLDEIKAAISELNHQGKYREVVTLLKQAVDLTCIEYGNNAPEYVSILNELGGLYRMLGEYDNSELAFLKAIDIQSETDGKDNPDYATSINNLAGTYRLKKRLRQSRITFLRGNRDLPKNSWQTAFFVYQRFEQPGASLYRHGKI